MAARTVAVDRRSWLIGRFTGGDVVAESPYRGDAEARTGSSTGGIGHQPQAANLATPADEVALGE